MKMSWIPVAMGLVAIASITSCALPQAAERPTDKAGAAPATGQAGADGAAARRAARFGLLSELPVCPPTTDCTGYALDGTADSDDPTLSFNVRAIDNGATDNGVITISLGTDIFVGASNFSIVRTGDGVSTDELAIDGTVTNIAESTDVRGVSIRFDLLDNGFTVQFGDTFEGEGFQIILRTCDLNEIPQ